MDWEKLAIQLLQTIFAGIPQSTILALKAWLVDEADAALISVWNGLVAWSKVRGPEHGFEAPDYWVELPAPGFPVPGPTDPGGQPPP